MSRSSTGYEHSSSNVNTTFIQSDQVFNNAVKTSAQKHLTCFSLIFIRSLFKEHSEIMFSELNESIGKIFLGHILLAGR